MATVATPLQMSGCSVDSAYVGTFAGNDPERQRLAAERGRDTASREAGAEQSRLAVPWHRWGTYLPARQWGTVREDYSRDGRAWESFPYEEAAARAYRWGEDGILGICDDQMRLCFAVALWNRADPHVKERLFGLSGVEGSHGEDVKECYYFLDGTPTHTYMRGLYRYPQAAFPYSQLRAGNARRVRGDPEYELEDTGIFADGRYFDVEVEYAKATPADICIRITATNRGSQPAPLHILPTLWFRNTWRWGRDEHRPELRRVPGEPLIEALHPTLGRYWLAYRGDPVLLFTENETNAQRLWNQPNATPYTKDGIDAAVVHGLSGAVNDRSVGTKLAAAYQFVIEPGATERVELRLSNEPQPGPFSTFDEIFICRRAEADEFYDRLPGVHGLSEDARRVQRQAYAGLMWSKQVYTWNVPQWLSGDPSGPTPPVERYHGRNANWVHFNTAHVLSVPDTWEYPWFAAWDLAFHCVPLAYVDPEFAKDQLTILLREWYMHPNGQIPAYEWSFDDVNPPVHAWAAWRVYQIDRELNGVADRAFLERVFHKLLLNFTWWVNRKDPEGLNVFQGGFLGLDNIGVFDRSVALPTGGHLGQSDGTAWMGMYCLNMLVIALELARKNDAYEEIANKFFQHFLYVASAMNNVGGKGFALWDDEDEFFYDILHTPSGQMHRLRVRSLVGLIPLLAVETIEPELLEHVPQFRARLQWMLDNRPDLAALISRWHEPGLGERRLLALVRGHRMKRLLKRLLDPGEFLSDFGVRSVSKFHKQHPYALELDGARYEVGYEPAESLSGMFGGNSNWRGPIWLPINYLLIEAVKKFHHYYGDDFLVECPTGSGARRTLGEIADELASRVTRLFLAGADGRRPLYSDGTPRQWQADVLFYEYFHGDSGAGLGASHQTGWTALVATLLHELATEARLT